MPQREKVYLASVAVSGLGFLASGFAFLSGSEKKAMFRQRNGTFISEPDLGALHSANTVHAVHGR